MGNYYWSTVEYLKKPHRDHFDFFSDEQITVITEFIDPTQAFIT